MGSKRDRNIQANLQRDRAQRDMKDHMGRLRDILYRLYLMQVLSNSQLHEAQRWLDDASRDVNKIDPSEESLFTMFTQQHYTALAQVIRETRQHITADGVDIPAGGANFMKRGVDELQLRLMKMLAKDNPKFKELLFIAAASEHEK